MITGICVTNLDDYRSQQWPKEFVSTPLIGDYIESNSGKVLKVVCITHCYSTSKSIPYIKIELHK